MVRDGSWGGWTEESERKTQVYGLKEGSDGNNVAFWSKCTNKGGVWTTTEEGMRRTTGREENQVFKSWEGRILNQTVFVRGEVRFVFYFF